MHALASVRIMNSQANCVQPLLPWKYFKSHWCSSQSHIIILLYYFTKSFVSKELFIKWSKLSCKNSLANIDFPNYKFYSTDSKTMAGGVGIYISSSLNAIHRSDLSFNSVEAESCWIEILQEHKPSIIVDVYTGTPRLILIILYLN